MKVSVSSTKTQISNAKLLFGSNGESTLKRLEELNKEKLLDTQHINILLTYLKKATPEQVEKFARSASSKVFVHKFKAVTSAKSITALFTAIREAKSTAAMKKAITGEPAVKPTPKPAETKPKPPAEGKLDKAEAIAAAKKGGRAIWDELNGKSKNRVKIFGYWRKGPLTEKAKLPFPVKLAVKGYDKDAFLRKLKAKERQAYLKHQKGLSPNRWTGGKNGSGEFSLDGWIWPQGVHFYLSRGVPPSREFFRFVTGKDNANLPY